MKSKLLSPRLMQIYFIISSLSIFTMFGLFRSNRVKIFLGIVCILFCAYILIKKKQCIIKPEPTKKEIMVALFLESVVFFDYYFNVSHIMPGLVRKLLSVISFLIPINQNVILFVLGFIGCLLGFFSACVMSFWIVKALRKVLFLIKTYRIQFILLSVVYLISFFAVIRANYYYTDDLGRTVEGYEITGSFSRYVASILSEVIHINSWLADVSPLAQIIALFIMAFTGIVILHIFSDLFQAVPSKWSFIALIPLGLSPYFLNCLSYKYDSPYMALSVLVSVFPLIYYKSSSVKFGVSVFAGTLIMCTTYQVSSGILPMTVVIILLLMWIKKYELKVIVRFVLTSATAYSAALLVFRLLIMEPIEDLYVDTGISLNNVIPNIVKYFTLFGNDLPIVWIILIAVIVLCFIGYNIKRTKRNKLLTLLIATIVTIISMILSFGIYLLFNDPLFTPRAFYGIGIFVSLISVPLIIASKNYLAKISVSCLSWIFVVFVFIYGNALSLQKEYVNFRTEQVVNELNAANLQKENEKLKVQVVGTIGYTKAVKNMIEEYPVIERLIPVLFSDSTKWEWGSYKLREYYGLNAELVDISNIEFNNTNMIKDTYYYSIYVEKDIVIVKLNDNS